MTSLPREAHAQSTYFWRSEAATGNWQQAGNTQWWQNGGSATGFNFGLLWWDNTADLIQTNNTTDASTFGFHFASGASAALTFTGSSVRFFDNGNRIRNASAATHLINFNVGLDGDAADPFSVYIDGAGGLTFNGTINTQPGGVGSTINVLGATASATTVTFNGVISGAGGFYKENANITALMTAANSYNGQTTIQNGTLRLAGSGSLANSAVRLHSGGTLSISNSATVSSVAEFGSGNSGAIAISNGAVLTVTANSLNLFQSSISGAGGLTKQGSHTLNLFGTQNYTGTTTVTLGQLSTSVAMSSTNFTINGGTFTTDAADRLANAAAVSISSGNFTIGGNDTVGSFSMTNGTLGGSSTLTAATYALGGGTITGNLGSGAATNTGTTLLNGTLGSTNLVVSGGTITLGSADRMSDTLAATVSGGTLNLGGFTDTVGSFTISSGVFTNGTLTAATYALQGGTVGGTLGSGAATNSTGSTTLSGVLNSTNLVVSGGTITLGSANRMSDTLAATVNGGTLNLGGFTDTVGSFTISSGVFTNGTLTAGSYTLSGGTVGGTLGAGAATSSTGTTTVSGALSGALTLSGGSVTTTGADKLSDTGAVTVNTGTLTIGSSDTIGALSGSGGTVSISAGTLTTSFDTASNNYAGTISGAGIFAKAGSGTLSLSGDASEAASLSVSAGRLQIGTGSTTGSIGNDSVALSSGANLAFNRSDNITYNGVISGSGGTLTKLGGGTLTISNTQTYTGATTVSAGTLSYMGTNTSTATTVGSGGTLLGAGSLGNVTVQSGGTIAPGASPGTLSVSNLTWEGGGNYNWQVYNAVGTAGATNGYDTIVGNSLNITATEGNKFNINLWSLSGVGPDVNGNAINFTNTSGYTWTLGSFTNGITNFAANLFSINTAATNNTTGFSNSFTGVFSIYTTNTTNLVLAYTAADNTYNVTVASGSTNQGAATGGTNQFVGVAALNKLGAGTLVMTNTNTYQGVTTIVEGAISIVTNAPSGANGALGNAITDVNIGTATNAVAAGFDIGAANVTNSRNLNIVAGSGAAARTIGTTNTTGTAVQAGGILFNTNATLYAASGGTMLYSGLLSGSGNLTISNIGTSIFSASNSYTGTTTILTNATLVIANGNALGSTASGTTVNSGGTVLLTNSISTGEAFTITGAGVGGNGAIRSFGSNTVTGAITLGGAATINNATDSTNILTLGTITGTGQALTMSVGNNARTIVSAINTSTGGTLIKTGGGALTISNASDFTGGTTISAGDIRMGNDASLGTGTVTINGSATITSDGATARNLTNNVVFSSGSLSLGATSFAGTMTVSGNVDLGGAARTFSVVGTSPATISGIISNGGLAKSGAGELTLSGANTYSGGTLVSAGKIIGSTTSLQGAITNDSTASGGVTFTQTTNGTYAGVLSGIGSVTKEGTGTVTLSGANSFAGAMTISAGTLSLGNATALGTTAAATSIANDASLNLNGQTVGAEAITLRGTGISSEGGIINTSATDASLSGAITLDRAASSIGTSAGNITISGAIGETNGARALGKVGTGTLILSGANAYTGATTISNGTLVAANNTALGTAAAATTVIDGATLAFSNNINSAEAITINGSGVGNNGALRNLSGANTNSGAVTLNTSGTNKIQVDSGSSLTLGAIAHAGTGRNLTVSANGTLTVTGAFTGGGINTVVQKDGIGALIISNGAASTTSGSQLQIGAGSVTVASGTFSTNTGTGTRALDLGISSTGDSASDTAFYAASGVTISNSIFVASQVGGLGARTIGTESTNGTVTYNNQMFLADGATLQIASAGNANVVYSGNITNLAANTSTISKTGSGTLTLSAVNTWRGGLVAGAGTTILSGGSAVWDTNAVTISNGAILSLGTTEEVGSIVGGGNITLGANQLRAGANNSSTEFSGIMSSSSDAATFVKKGGGVLTLSGANTMSGQLFLVAGNTLFTTNQGAGFTNTINLGEDLGGVDNATLTLGGSGVTLSNLVNVRSGSSNNTMLIAASNSTGTSVLAGGITLNRAATLSAQGGGALVVSNAVTLGQNQLRVTNAANSAVTIAGNISSTNRISGELLVDGPGTTTITGNNSGDMKITLGGGTLVVGNITNLGNPTTGDFFGSKLNLNGGTLSATNDVTAGSLFGVTISASGGNLLASSGKTLKFVDFINDAGAGTAAYTLGIGGGGTVVFEKASGNNQFNGNMTFAVTNGSTLSTPNLGALGNSATNIISLNNGTFAYTGNTGTASQRFTIGASGGTVNVSTTNQTLSLTNAATLTGTLTKSGNGILDINRANTGTGGANVTGGILRIGNASALGTGGNVEVSSGATLQLSNGINFARTLSLSGNGSVSGALLNVSGANTNSGTITLANGGAIVGVSGGSLLVSGGISGNGGANRLTLDTYGEAGTPLTISGAYTNSTGGLSKIAGGVAILSGANTYSGGTLISAGTLQIGAGGATGQLGTGNITNNATLAVNRTGALAIADAISGGGVLTKSGASTLTLGGANTYGGGTLISAGTLAGSTLSIQGSITNNSALIFDQSTNGTYASVISGTGTLAKTNSGAVTLTGANTFSGGVTVNGGTLILDRTGGPALGGTNALIINDGGTLRTDQAGQIVGAPLVTVNTGGTYNLNGNNQTNALAGAGNVSLGAATLSISNTGTDNFSGVASGAGGLTKIGLGVQTLSGANDYTGATTITAGELALGAHDVIGDSSAVIVNGGTFTLGTRDDTVASLTMSSGSVSRGAGILTLNGASALTGGAVSYTAAGGRLIFGGTLELGGVTFSYGSASTPSGSQDTIRLGGNVGYASSATGQALFTNTAAGVGAFDLGDAQRTLNLTNSGTLGAGTPEMAVYWAVRGGGITKDGTGALLLGHANTHTNTTLTAGDLLVGDDAAVGAGTVNLNGGTFASADATARIITNALSIGGDITLGQASGGTGVLTFSNADLGNVTRSITAVTNVNFVGAVTNGSLVKAGNATLALSNTGTSLANLNITAGTVAVQTNATVGGLAGSGSGALSIAGGTLTVNASTNSSFGQVISGAGGLIKSGSGTVTLSGNNTYDGATTVSGGRLALTGTNTSSAILVTNTGTLSGTGNVGNVVVAGGGLIAPGSSPGNLTVGNFTMGGGGGYEWEIVNVAGTPGSEWDLITITGSTSITATSGSPFTIFITGNSVTGWDENANTNWVIMDWAGGTGPVSFDPTAFALNTTGFGDTISGNFSLSTNATSLLLFYNGDLGTPTYSGGSGVWSTGFSPDLVNSSDAIFDGAGGTATNNISTNTITTLGTITFATNATGSYTLVAASGSAGFDTNSPLVMAGGIVNESAYAQTVDLALSLSSTKTANAASNDIILNGDIIGSSGINKIGDNMLVLNGANSYAGATTISNGTVRLGSATALGTTAAGTTVSSGAVLDLYGQTVDNEAVSIAGTGISGGGALINSSGSAASLGGALTLTANATVNTTGDLTLSSAVGGAFTLTKNGAGALNFGASNTVTGMTLNAGTVRFGVNNGLGTGTLTINGGTLANTNASARTLSNNVVVGGDFGIGQSSVGATILSGNIDLTGDTRTVTVVRSSTFSGVVSNGGLNINAVSVAPTLTLSGANTFSGPLTINGGEVAMSGGGTLNTSVAVNISRTNASSRFSIDGITADTFTIGSLAAADSATAAVNLGGKTLIAGGNNTSTTFGGVISNAGSFVKTGTGTMTFTRASTYTGATTISNGEIALTNAGGLSSSSALNLAGGSSRLDISGISASGSTNGSLAGVGGSIVNLGSKNLNVGGDNTSTAFAGVISNTGSLTKTGTGTMTLSGANTFSGGSTLSAGVLRVNSTGALGTGALTQVDGASTLQVNAGGTITNNMSVYNVEFVNGGNTLSGTLTQNNTTYDVNAGETNNLDGFLTGSGGVTLIGGGQLNLTGTTNNYTGNTVISNGTLQISTLANSNTVSSIGVSNNITLAGTANSTNANSATTAAIDYTGGNVTTDRTFVVNEDGGTINMASSSTEMTLTGAASGGGKLIVGEGTLVLSNTSTANSFAPASIQVDSGATLKLAASDQIGNSTGLILNGGTFLVGASTLSESLGTLTLSASSTIDFGAYGASGLRQITFADSSAITWTGTLTITNWQGVALNSSAFTKLVFGVDGLNNDQLGDIVFASQGITGGELIGGGELVPVPEPRVYAAAVALLAVVGWRERKRLLGLLSRGKKPKA
jgi:autotransporter-associated beta strand protein